MGDTPTSRTPRQFSFENICGTKHRLVVNLQLESTDEEEIESEPEVEVQEEETSEIYTTESSTVQDEKVNEGTIPVIFCIEDEETENKPEVVFISGFNSPVWQGYHYAFQITQEEFGFLVFYNGTTLVLTKRREDTSLYTEWTFGFYKEEDYYTGYPRYVLSTPFFLSLEAIDRSQDSLLSDRTVSFKLIKYETNIACRADLNAKNSEHFQNWLNQQFWTRAEFIACALEERAPRSIYTIIHKNIELGCPKESGEYYI
jgi:hypothetical protein